MGDVTLSQLLHVQCGETVVDKIQSSAGRLAGLLSAIPAAGDESAMVEELFLSSLSRLPRDDERAAIHSERTAASDAQTFYQDLLWALLRNLHAASVAFRGL